MSQNFKLKTVVITGASAGVGAACARAFAALGANLVLAARGQENLDSIAAELSELTDVCCVVMDVGNPEQCSDLIEQSLAQFGSIDVLINNAGLHKRGDVLHNTSADLQRMVDVNLRAPIQLTTEALPHMVKAGSGAIIMVGSLAGRAPLQGAATYAATKAGLRAFVYSLTEEVKHQGINVGLVSPGPINTGFIMDEIDNVEDIVYSQPMSTREEVAHAVVEIASGGQTEIAMPWFSGKLTTLAYLSPALRRWTRPALYRIGRKNKNKYRD